MKLGIQVYSVREQAAADLFGTLKALKEMGYDGVELAGLYEHSAAEIRAMADEVGLEIISAHVPYKTMVEDPEGVLADYKTMGCKYFAIPHIGGDYRPGGKEYDTFLQEVRKISAVGKKLGLVMLYHNHDFEFARIDGEYKLDKMYKDLPADVLQTELDTCWVRVGGEDPAAFITKYSGRAPVVHLKDYWGQKAENMYDLIGEKNTGAPKRPEGFEFRPVGSGVQDFPGILKASEAAGATWVIVEQDQPSMDLTPLECAAKSCAYLRSIGV